MTDAKPQKRRYVRVYYIDLQGDYPAIWFDPTCLSTWLRLLVLADQAWPANAELPRSIRRADLEMLENVGLVTMLDRNRFSMKGYEAERTERAIKARCSVSQRADRSTNVQRPYNERTTTVQRTYNERSHAGAGASDPLLIDVAPEESPERNRPDVEAFRIVRRRAPSPKQWDVLDSYQAAFDVSGPERAAKLILEHPDDPIGALLADLATFRGKALLEAQKAEFAARAEQRSNRKKVTDPVGRELLAEWARQRGEEVAS